MLRVARAIVCMVLAGALWHSVARASRLPDFATAFAMQTFGNAPADAPHFAPAGKNALRGLAFATISPFPLPSAVSRAAGIAVVPVADLDFRSSLDRYAAFVPRATHVAPRDPNAVAVARFAARHSVAEPPSYALFTGDGGGVASPGFASALRDTTTAYEETTHAGFRTTGVAETSALSALSATDQRLQTTTSIGIGRRLALKVGSEYERVSSQSSAALQAQRAGFGNATIDDVPGYDGARIAGTYNDVTARGVNAGVAVPVGRFTLGMQYGTQRYTGALATTDFTPNFDTSKYSYVGDVTFALPHSSSAIVFSARQYRYQDNLVPSNTTYQTRADVNFTVKF